MSTELWVDYRLTRGPIKGALTRTVGLILRIQANPVLETYMQQLSKGRALPVDSFGDLWHNCGNKDKGLEVYDVSDSLSTKNYQFNAVAQPLTYNRYGEDGPRVRRAANGLEVAEPARVDEDIINLSFLKLVGISDEGGVTVGIAGAYSAAYMQTLQSKLPAVTKEFLRDFIVPITINLQIISRTD